MLFELLEKILIFLKQLFCIHDYRIIIMTKHCIKCGYCPKNSCKLNRR